VFNRPAIIGPPIGDAEPFGAVTRRRFVGIGDNREPCPGNPPRKVLGVQFANPARADETNIYYTLHHNFSRCHMLAGRMVFANPCQNHLPMQLRSFVNGVALAVPAVMV